MLKHEVVYLTVRTLTALVAGGRRDKAITAVAGIVKALAKIASLTNVQNFIVLIGHNVHASVLFSVYRKSTKRACALFQELFVSFVLISSLRIEFYYLSLFVSFGN